MTNNNMALTISGGRLPIAAFVIGVTALISSIIYSTVWLTKLDDRVFDNSTNIAEITGQIDTVTKLQTILQSNCSKQTFILDTMIKRVEKLEEGK